MPIYLRKFYFNKMLEAKKIEKEKEENAVIEHFVKESLDEEFNAAA